MNNTNNNSNNHANGAVTIDDLAVMITKGFDEVHKKMSGMITKEEFNKRLDKVEERLDRIEERLDKVEERLDRIEYEISVLKSDVAEIKADLRKTKQVEQDDTRVISGDYFKLLKRVKIIEEKIQQLELARA